MTDQETLPTSDRLVMAAMTLFAEKGYNSTSVADILREAGANSGSLYHAFPTKQDLLLEVLRRYRDGIGPMLLEPAWAGVDEPIERIFALLAAYRGMLARSDCLYGCPIGSLALELHEPDPPVRELLAINFDGWTGAIEACLAATPESLPRDANGTRLARFVLTVMEGGVMQSRTHRSLEAFDACVDTLRDYFDRLRDAAKNETKPGETS
ncbi:MAG TPA: TetR/AcrR family transcriptional regulator [Caulobacteraceae bacterium]|jgi:AcrR family transcriptional regulator